MVRKYFGTDGMRGTVNQGNMTAEMALKLAMAAGKYFMRGDHRHRVVIGKDTRLSGYMLEPALVAGFTAMGMDVITTGPVPTPAIAHLTQSFNCDLGVMISASHNPYYDNGIKLFGPDGYKLSDDAELKIESLMDDENWQYPNASETGNVQRMEDAVGRYIEFIKATLPKGTSYTGLKVVLDCANGAAHRIAPTVLTELGADIITIGATPDGRNINDGVGATAPDALCQAVLQHGAHVGLALDGDADRLIVADETGQVIDGDQLMALLAMYWHDLGLLKGGVVATVMSNLGFERALQDKGIDLIRTKVGDRYVMETMRQTGYNVGGEQSGHMILSDYATTGDGILAGLQVLSVLKSKGKPMSEVGRVFTPVPQLLKNVRFDGVDPLQTDPVKTAIVDAEKQLDGVGRLVIRKSGTEPLIRVMAESDDNGLVNSVVDGLCDVIKAS